MMRSVVALGLVLVVSVPVGCSKKTTTSEKQAPPGPDKAPAPPAAKVVVAACNAVAVEEEDIQGGLLGSDPNDPHQGYGFGTAGYGVGSNGGTGMGTIGRGQYGTIGHGTGTGYGAGRRAPSRAAEVHFGTVSVVGDLDKDIIRRYLRQRMSQVEYCYAKQLLSEPSLAGTLTAAFVIDGKGKTISADATGLDGKPGIDVASCVVGVLRSIQFPKPTGGGVVKVTVPFTLRPGGSVGAPAAPLGPPAAPAPDAGPPPVSPELAQAATGATAALRDGVSGLEACYTQGLTRAPTLGGTVTARFRINTRGEADQRYASGVGDGDVEACLADAIHAMKFTAIPKAVRLTCELTLGAAAPRRPTVVTAIPVVTITADAVTVDGKPVAQVAALLADKTSFQIDALSDVLWFRHQQLEDNTTDENKALVGRLTVQAAKDTEATLVSRVVETARRVGYTTLAMAVESKPGVYEPVPNDPGVTTAPNHGTDSNGGAPVIVSILVAADVVWIGDTKDDHRRLKDFHADLPAVLKEFKANPLFEDRTDIEIAAEEAVPYARIIEVMDMCVAAGWKDIGLVEPASLSVRFKM